MANADQCFLSLCLLLVLTTTTVTATATATTAAAAAPAPAPHRRLHQTPPRLEDDANPRVPSILPPSVEACWRSILASESCEDDVLRSLATQQVHISKACCSVLEKIGEKCVVAAFSSFPFGPTYPNLVKNACGLNA